MTKGTLKNNETGLEIHGEIGDGNIFEIVTRIDGTTVFNSFLANEWTFTEDREPLPTTNGSAVTDGMDRFVRVNGFWISASMDRNRSNHVIEEHKQGKITILFDAGKEK